MTTRGTGPPTKPVNAPHARTRPPTGTPQRSVVRVAATRPGGRGPTTIWKGNASAPPPNPTAGSSSTTHARANMLHSNSQLPSGSATSSAAWTLGRPETPPRRRPRHLQPSEWRVDLPRRSRAPGNAWRRRQRCFAACPIPPSWRSCSASPKGRARDTTCRENDRRAMPFHGDRQFTVSALFAGLLRHIGPTVGAPCQYIVVPGKTFPGQSSERVSQP